MARTEGGTTSAAAASNGNSNGMGEALLPPSATTTTTTTTTDTTRPDHQPILTITSAAPLWDDDDEDDGDDDTCQRQGTIASARFNILSTMVGGGCLSLPLAFQQSGNSLLGPLLLVLTGAITEFCFNLLVKSAEAAAVSDGQQRRRLRKPGKDSFESVAQAAFGPKAYIMSQCLVFFMCFFGAVGYSVLLRDMMEPINDAIVHHFRSFLPSVDSSSAGADWIRTNLTMFAVILFVTPATTLQTLTSLKNCGATSMLSIVILGSCIVFRSFQCQWNSGRDHPWYTYLTWFPESPLELLDAVPLYISCFVCHYNILPVHNELQDPTPQRVQWWLKSTTWYAVGLYSIMGWFGSAYGHCTPSGTVHGNVLLDFDKHDPLLLVGRMCLALTITLAFPMLVIPGRDIVLRTYLATTTTNDNNEDVEVSPLEQLQVPLLPQQQENGNEPNDEEVPTNGTDNNEEGGTTSSSSSVVPSSFIARLLVSMAIFWTAGTVASLVDGIEVVWDLLGSSLSILLSYLIPCGCYLMLTNRTSSTDYYADEDSPEEKIRHRSRIMCWILLGIFTPLMFVSTGNAIHNTFF
eukprot:scaffold2042_cov123-Cylindrotheca_fusiformis.AAC.5